ncbi:MAG: hypothetical protein JOZ54_20300 [Acidobacteria bacterium]|nr:hypothetical protein [Acidobacteriota bacterium]
MSFFRNHVVLMVIYATAVALFFALLWRETRQERIRFFVRTFLALVVGGLALSWAMYPFPIR